MNFDPSSLSYIEFFFCRSQNMGTCVEYLVTVEVGIHICLHPLGNFRVHEHKSIYLGNILSFLIAQVKSTSDNL